MSRAPEPALAFKTVRLSLCGRPCDDFPCGTSAVKLLSFDPLFTATRHGGDSPDSAFEGGGCGHLGILPGLRRGWEPAQEI